MAPSETFHCCQVSMTFTFSDVPSVGVSTSSFKGSGELRLPLLCPPVFLDPYCFSVPSHLSLRLSPRDLGARIISVSFRHIPRVHPEIPRHRQCFSTQGLGIKTPSGLWPGGRGILRMGPSSHLSSSSHSNLSRKGMTQHAPPGSLRMSQRNTAKEILAPRG